MYPVFTVIINAFKPLGEIVRNPFTLPKAFANENISNIINMSFFRALFDTLFVAVIVVLATVIVASMAGYKMGCVGGKVSTVISRYLSLVC
jgi:raffinose/stachyose/melibiose transport system permease protein